MSEVTRYDIAEDSDGIFDVWPIPPHLEGRYVKYEDYAALLQKLEASEALMLAMRDDSRESRSKLELVVAENMALKKQSVRIFNAGYSRGHESTVEGDYVHVYRADEDSFHTDDVQELLAENTPASDAMVNEIRAEGVELAINHLINKFEGTGHIGVPVMALESFANQLRADAAKGGSDD